MREERGRQPLMLVAAALVAGTIALPGTAAAADAPLIAAARSGDAARVAVRLAEGADAGSASPDGTTALHWAARAASADAVEHLLAAGADAKSANRYGVTPLALAAESGAPAVVAALLAAGADPNTATPAGESVLMVAARTGRVPVLDQLLAAGAAVDATESWRGQTALMWAAAENNGDAVARLLAAGADVEARSSTGLTPLLFAVREGQIDAARTLLAGGADVNAGVNNTTAGTGSYTPAATGHTSPLALAIINAHYELAADLLDAGADPNAYDARGSLLHALAWIRRPGSGRPPEQTGTLDSLELARRLLAQGADPNVRIFWQEIPFEVDLGIVKPPPNISVGRNYISFIGATPFYLAAKHADLDLMRLLVDYGADPLTPTGQGVTPLMAAAGLGFWDGESPGPLNGTPEHVRLEAVKMTLALGNDLHAVSDFGDTQIEGDGVDLLLRHPLNLLELDAQRDRGDMRWGGCTALHGAAMMGSNLIVQYLIDQGADVNARNAIGWTPRMVAEGVFVANTEKAWPDTVALLRELGGETVERR
ncbi:MAG: ankyrin repeat domain-containing protein [Acidobacteria bacterium]|nr:ankyrin repeat domain-containing protein [Acidobacteriota bacterium]